METLTLKTQKDLSQIKTQADAVVDFICKMHIEMIDAILDPDRTYQGFPKDAFIKKLLAAFNEFVNTGDTYLHCYAGHCGGKTCCNYGSKGFSFIGHYSGNYMNLLIDVENGVVQDINECGGFLTTEDSNMPINNRIYINEIDFDFPL